MRNPIANAGQFAAEAEVRMMWDMPETRVARDHAAQLWRVGYGVDAPSGLEESFESAMDGWVTNYLFKAAANDPVEPRFVRNFMPSYSWNGEQVPDARMGGDNPDNCYRLAAIEHGGCYRITGSIVDERPAHISFTLVENWGTSVTVQTLELPGIEVSPDGHFTITIDATPANGRTNHLTTNPRVKFLFVRDSMMDWASETPLSLEIERLDRSGKKPVPLEVRHAEALRRLREDVPLYYWFQRLSAGKAVNTMPQPTGPGGVGGLVTQASSIGRLHLADDQAAVVRFDPAGASYSSLQLVMWWYRSIDAHQRQSGLSACQANINDDGTITAVISAQDPGVANWIDTGGFRDLLPMVRWQGLSGQKPIHWLEVVQHSELERYLPAGMVRMDGVERAGQLHKRQAEWVRRIAL